MNTTMKTAALAVMLTAAMALSGCKKVPGPKGDPGQPGATGPAGNANVKTAESTASGFLIGCNGTCWASKNYCAILDASATDRGIVTVYAKVNNEWFGLPLTASDVEVYYSYSLNSITIYFRSASGQTSVEDPGSVPYKIVVAPPAN